MTELLSRKDRERQAKRQDILRAARVVFAEKGLHAATLDEIAEKAEFAKGTLYTYFENKEDLFLSMLEDEIGRFFGILKQVIDQRRPPDQKIRMLGETMLQEFDENSDLMRLLSQERSALVSGSGDAMELRFLPHFHRLIGMIAQIVKEGIAQGAFARVDPERAATAVFNLCHGAAISAYLNKKKINGPEEVKFITGLVLHGIMNRK